MKTILIVDDTPANITLLVGALSGEYQTRVATSGRRALELATEQPDLILLDVMMPEMDGYEVCRRLKADPATAAIPVIFVTARTEVDDETLGLDLGSVDYIHKPISPPIVRAARTEDLSIIQDVTMLAMASLAETRDNETGNHIRRTQQFVHMLALALRNHPRFSTFLDSKTIDLIRKSAPLHDIGKVGIPDSILLKPGRFTPEEFAIMQRHTILGRDALIAAEQGVGRAVPFLHLAKEIAYSHQEKWDGSGYPQSLSGDAIPIAARLMAVADVYDALTSRRVYKQGMPHEQAVDVIRESRGSHFDPDIVDAFLSIAEDVRIAASRYVDKGS